MNGAPRNFGSGVFLVFAVYFYFLIFAQFAFLELVRQSGRSAVQLKEVMAAMAAGGLLGSALVPALASRLELRSLLRAGLAGCAATLVVLALPPGALIVAAFLIGLSLGTATVSLAASLPALFPKDWAMGTALGTGLAYAAANLPALFQASPAVQAICAALAAATAVPLVPRIASIPARPPDALVSRIVFLTLFFGLLVWFDSAAFYIIQHTGLKDGTWGDPAALWRNAAIHFAAAVLAGTLLPLLGFVPLLSIAFLLLGISGLSANQPETRGLVGWLYPAGVSIYSACLVCFPAFGSGARAPQTAAWTAALLYGFSGWICSGLGIGMAENLQRIPWQFVAIASSILVLPKVAPALLRFRREIGCAALALSLAWLASRDSLRSPAPSDPIARGRAVYLAEGCINCHSQFVKPGRDELLWGPAQPAEVLARARPPLFGNRRHGPDLANVGNRRSAAWLRLHFIRPRLIAPGSSMPAYPHLFQDERGEALIAYLTSLQAQEPRPNRNWRPSEPVACSSDPEELFRLHCACCHETPRNLPLLKEAGFAKVPPNLSAGPFLFAPIALPSAIRIQQLARIVKFGLPGTDMPGHEYLSDQDVFALARHVEQISRRE